MSDKHVSPNQEDPVAEGTAEPPQGTQLLPGPTHHRLVQGTPLEWVDNVALPLAMLTMVVKRVTSRCPET